VTVIQPEKPRNQVFSLLLLHIIQAGSVAHPALLLVNTKTSFPRHETDYTSQYSVEFKMHGAISPLPHKIPNFAV
jgi:hypothetical protein